MKDCLNFWKKVKVGREKQPAYKSRPPYIALEVNPVDTSGIATKRRGILIRSRSELEQISNILTNAKIIQLAASIDEVNPEKKTKPLSTETDVYEIWNKKENKKNGQGQLRFAQLFILTNINQYTKIVGLSLWMIKLHSLIIHFLERIYYNSENIKKISPALLWIRIHS